MHLSFFLTSANKFCGLDTIWKLRFLSILHFTIFCFKTNNKKPSCFLCVWCDQWCAQGTNNKKNKLLVASKLSRAVEHCSILKVLAIASPVSPPTLPWSYSVSCWLLLLLYLCFIFMWIELPVKSFLSSLLLLFPPSQPHQSYLRGTLSFPEH